MKKLTILMALIACSMRCFSQQEEVEQLLLNVEKLTQFKKILNDMYTGYKIIYKGYSTIKNLSEGNFSLHKNYLNALSQVSPVVRRYSRIGEILNMQQLIVKEGRLALNSIKVNKHISAEELKYIGDVYTNLFKVGIESLNELSMVIISGTLRMSDDERLSAIDKVYKDVFDQFAFLKEFARGTSLLSIQREMTIRDIDQSRKIIGLNN